MKTTINKNISRDVIRKHTHKCIRCGREYTPCRNAKTEDCPFCGCDGIMQNNREADIRLIMAAPELLEALEALVNAGNDLKPYSFVWDKARAAIEKAKGE